MSNKEPNPSGFRGRFRVWFRRGKQPTSKLQPETNTYPQPSLDQHLKNPVTPHQIPKTTRDIAGAIAEMAIEEMRRSREQEQIDRLVPQILTELQRIHRNSSR